MFSSVVEGARVLLICTQVVSGTWCQIYVFQCCFLTSAQVDVVVPGQFNRLVILHVIVRPWRLQSFLRFFGPQLVLLSFRLAVAWNTFLGRLQAALDIVRCHAACICICSAVEDLNVLLDVTSTVIFTIVVFESGRTRLEKRLL